MDNLIKRILSSIILLPLVFYFILQGSHILFLFITAFLIIACYEWHKMNKNLIYKFCGFIFLIISFFIFYKLSNEVTVVVFIILICVSTDVGGYVFGKIFKGPKLTKISPNKTYAGVAGGYALSIIFLLTFNFYFEQQIIPSKYLLISTILISTVSQIGDLIISYFKRQSKVKNTGEIIPGHGGLLDRIDGMIFAFPSYYFIGLNININI